MQLKLVFVLLLVFSINIFAQNTDSFRLNETSDSTEQNTKMNIVPPTASLNKFINDLPQWIIADSTIQHLPDNVNFTAEDSLVYLTNPFFIDLIYLGKNININYENFFENYNFGAKPQKLGNSMSDFYQKIYFNDKTGTASLQNIRNEVQAYLIKNAAELFSVNIWELPDPLQYKPRIIMPKPPEKLHVTENLHNLLEQKPMLAPIVPLYWLNSANALVQFTQNYISSNWYQGGTGSMAMLMVVSANFNYDNRKGWQWTNAIEWRAGIIAVADTTKLRTFNTGDDVLKIDSKLALKAKGRWSYSVLMNFSTQFFENYKTYNSEELKAKLFTPVRFNFGLGMNYAYKKSFSLMLAPVSYKFIYLADSVVINPNLFGIKAGKNQLNEIGSSLTAQLTWKPFAELQVNSTLKAYTNYSKVEIDWEIIANFNINRYLSTRLLINPRYDNTVIMTGSEKAQLQLKELLSFGFNYKFQ
jgi:hypothetical protein